MEVDEDPLMLQSNEVHEDNLLNTSLTKYHNEGVLTQTINTIVCPRCGKEFPHEENVDFIDHFDECNQSNKDTVNISPNKCKAKSQENISSKTACQFCGKFYKRVRTHITRAHPEHHRTLLASKYVSDVVAEETSSAQENIEDVPTDDNTIGLEENILLSDLGRISHKLNDDEAYLNTALDKWIACFKLDHDKDSFGTIVNELSKFLASAVQHLPGPKHPATHYYQARKNGNFKSNARNNQGSSNPQRASKRDREKRNEKYLYQKTQFLYYNQRKKAVSTIVNIN